MSNISVILDCPKCRSEVVIGENELHCSKCDITPEELIYELDIETHRVCSHCGKVMQEGYCIENGMAYYCSDECLKAEMTWEEYEELYNDGDGDSYYTDWR